MEAQNDVHSDVQLTALVAPVVNALDLDLWGIELLPQGHDKVVRIYIDSEDGVKLEECEAVSRQLSALFDVEEPISGNYTLEVSSPGMDRPLYNEAQFKLYVGSEVKLKLRVRFDGRRNLRGIITAVEDGEISMRVDDHEYTLPLESIEKAKIVPRF
jgi:ribosome maturation factor RimP